MLWNGEKKQIIHEENGIKEFIQIENVISQYKNLFIGIPYCINKFVSIFLSLFILCFCDFYISQAFFH